MRALTLLVAFFWAAAPTLAQTGLQLYVRNQPFQGLVRILGGDVYVPLEDMLSALDCSWKVQDDQIVVSSAPGGGPPLEAQKRLIIYEGRLLRLAQELYAGRLLVSVSQLAQGMGLGYRVNAATRTAEVYGRAESMASRPDLVRTTGSDGRSPLKLVALSHQMVSDPDGDGPPRLLGYAVVRNQGPLPVKDVLLTVVICDGQGRSLARFSWICGDVAPGQEVSWQFPVWTNLERVEGAHPVLEIQHEK
jgi:hypothetical protein